MISKTSLIVCKIVFSWDVPKFGGDLPSVYAFIFAFKSIFFSSSFSYSNGYVKNFPITVCGINLSQQDSIITYHFTIRPVFHIYLPVMCICYYKENSRKKLHYVT